MTGNKIFGKGSTGLIGQNRTNQLKGQNNLQFSLNMIRESEILNEKSPTKEQSLELFIDGLTN